MPGNNGGFGIAGATAEEIAAAGGGGGGGGDLTFPDAIVTGSGSLTIPVGFNGIVTARSHFTSFTINGAIVFESAVRITNLNRGIGAGPLQTLMNESQQEAEFDYVIGGAVTSPSFTYFREMGSNATVDTAIQVLDVREGDFAIATTGVGLKQPLESFVQFSGNFLTIVNVSVTQRKSKGKFIETFNLPEGTVINGGFYVAELYLI